MSKIVSKIGLVSGKTLIQVWDPDISGLMDPNFLKKKNLVGKQCPKNPKDTQIPLQNLHFEVWFAFGFNSHFTERNFV